MVDVAKDLTSQLFKLSFVSKEIKVKRVIEVLVEQVPCVCYKCISHIAVLLSGKSGVGHLGQRLLSLKRRWVRVEVSICEETNLSIDVVLLLPRDLLRRRLSNDEVKQVVGIGQHLQLLKQEPIAEVVPFGLSLNDI